MLPRSLLHQAAGSGEGGEFPWNTKRFSRFISPVLLVQIPEGPGLCSHSWFSCQVEVIGGADKYHSVCRACYFRKRPQPPGSENKENVPVGVKQLDVAASQKVFA